MTLNIRGHLSDQPKIRAGFIGCGSHAFRNIFPTFQFAPVELIATCDLNPEKASAFAKQFGAQRSYSNHHEMLANEKLDAVFIVTGYDPEGRPLYCRLAADCLRAGTHVWMEKPPAASSQEIADLRVLAQDRKVMVGLKKMFFPANEKMHELMHLPDFGKSILTQITYPENIPTPENIHRYLHGRSPVPDVVSFLDHLCHPIALLLFLQGMPATMFYERGPTGAGVATFTYPDGRLATLTLAKSAPANMGIERTTIISDQNRSIVVENNLRVLYHRDAPNRGYGTSPTYFLGAPEQTTALWEPEFSLGQLYNKGLFLLGYFGEVNEFATAILENRPLKKAHLDHAFQATQIFEAFAQGPRKIITL